LIIGYVCCQSTNCAFTYLGDNGPLNWPTICNNQYALCGSGVEQSPIDIIPHLALRNITGNATAVDGEDVLIPLITDYNDDNNATIVSDGQTLKIIPSTSAGFGYLAGYPLVDGVQGSYSFIYATLHSTSEHLVYGAEFDLELQLWHYSRAGNGSYIVLSFLFVDGDENLFLENLVAVLYNQTNSTGGFSTSAPMAWKTSLNVSRDAPYWYYRGSMTTPPCLQQVHWFVFSDFAMISPVQSNVMLQVLKNNFRPLQRLGNRTVYFFDGSLNTTHSVGDSSDASNIALFNMW